MHIRAETTIALLACALGLAGAPPRVRALPGEPNEAPPPPEKVQSLDGDAPDATTGDGREVPDAADAPGEPGTPHKARSHGAPHRHDGFMLRVHAGVGLGRATLRSAPEMRVSGLGAAGSLDLGYGLDDAFTVLLRYSLVTVLTGDAKLGSERVGQGPEPYADASMLGLGLTYFLMPANLHATLAVGLGVSSVEVDQYRDTNTDMGWAFNLDLGKDWWVDDNACVGAAVRGWFSAMAAESGANVYVPMVALLVSASYQ